jgi:hypothetical protein
MSESDFKKIDKTKLPWYYRLVLKILGTSFLEDVMGFLEHSCANFYDF